MAGFSSNDPPPFFVRGPSPLAKLTVFGLAALVLMFVDSRFRTLDSVRSVVATVTHPLQRVALMPIELWRGAAGWFESRVSIQAENTTLRERALNDSVAVQGFGALQTENEQLRTLLNIQKTASTKSIAAQVLYAGRDPFTQRAFLDRGTQHGVQIGQAVIDSKGLVGQVTRAHPLVSEITLITDKDHAVPIKNERTGVRSVMFGRGSEYLPELRFVAATVDVQVGDTLTTSGLDGIYPPALAVARVVSVSREPGQLFARITCAPIAGTHASRQLLVLESPVALPELPVDAPEKPKTSVRR
jgi:rod shape-determining protein MreC